MTVNAAPSRTRIHNAHGLADNAPLSLAAMKALINREMQFRDGIPHGDIDEIVDKARTSEDAQEGMKARLEKRRAMFRGV